MPAYRRGQSSKERVPEAGIEVLSFGAGGYNPYTEAELFKDIGVSYEPDLVVVQFFVSAPSKERLLTPLEDSVAESPFRFATNDRIVIGTD